MSAALPPDQRLAPPLARAWLGVLAVTAVLVAPLWCVSIVPVQDGYVHLSQADMIARFGWGGVLSGPAAIFYEWNPRLEPNYAVYALLAALVKVVGDPFVAHTVYLTLYGVLFAVAAFACARAETRQALVPFLFVMPVAFGRLLHMGFYNCMLGFPAFFAFATLWRRCDGKRTVATWAMFAALLFVLGLTHLSAVVVSCLFMAAAGIARAVAACGRKPAGALARSFAGDAIWSLAIAAPALGLVVSFVLAYPRTTEPAIFEHSLSSVLRWLFGLTYLYSFSFWEIGALVPIGVAMLACAVLATRAALAERRLGDLVWPIFVGLLIIVSLADPRTAKGVSLADRLAPYTWVGIALALASRLPGPRALRVAGVAAVVSLSAHTVVRGIAYRSWAETLDAIVAAGRASPRGTFAGIAVQTWSSAQYAWRVLPATHAHHLAAIASGGVSLGSTLPSMRYFGYFPLRYVPARDFCFLAPHWENDPQAVSIAPYRAASSGAPATLFVVSPDGWGASLGELHGYVSCRRIAGTTRSLVICEGLARDR